LGTGRRGKQCGCDGSCGSQSWNFTAPMLRAWYEQHDESPHFFENIVLRVRCAHASETIDGESFASNEGFV
jgi:hypothetical protein